MNIYVCLIFAVGFGVIYTVILIAGHMITSGWRKKKNKEFLLENDIYKELEKIYKSNGKTYYYSKNVYREYLNVIKSKDIEEIEYFKILLVTVSASSP